MKTITLFLTGIMISIQLFSSQNLMADNNLTEIQKTKYKLTRYLLTCESTAYLIYSNNGDEKSTTQIINVNEKEMFFAIGMDYYNKAYSQYLILQNTGNIDKEENKNLELFFEGYKKLFNSNDAMDGRSGLFMTALLDRLLNKFIINFWGDK
jgi:hypothetical protein